jgi:hypothetical protein
MKTRPPQEIIDFCFFRIGYLIKHNLEGREVPILKEIIKDEREKL